MRARERQAIKAKARRHHKLTRAAEQAALVRKVKAGVRGSLKELRKRFPHRAQELARERRQARAIKRLPPKKREFVKRSIASKKGWGRRKLALEREKHVPRLPASAPENARLAHHVVLRLMVDSMHPDFEAFLKRGTGLGLTRREIKNQWFSPKIKKDASGR